MLDSSTVVAFVHELVDESMELRYLVILADCCVIRVCVVANQSLSQPLYSGTQALLTAFQAVWSTVMAQ